MSQYPLLRFVNRICHHSGDVTVTLFHLIKSLEVTYNALVSACFRTGGGENAIPTVIIMFV